MRDSREMGLDDVPADFCEKIAERALGLFHLDGSKAFEEARLGAWRAFEHAKGLNRRKIAVDAVIDLRNAKADAVRAAAKAQLGALVNTGYLYDSALKEEDTAPADILYNTLKAKGLRWANRKPPLGVASFVSSNL